MIIILNTLQGQLATLVIRIFKGRANHFPLSIIISFSTHPFRYFFSCCLLVFKNNFYNVFLFFIFYFLFFWNYIVYKIYYIIFISILLILIIKCVKNFYVKKIFKELLFINRQIWWLKRWLMIDTCNCFHDW